MKYSRRNTTIEIKLDEKKLESYGTPRMYVDWRACDSRYESSLQEKARLNRAFSNWPLRTQLKCERSEGADRDRCSGISISRCSYLFEYLLLVHSIEISWVIRMVFLTICEEKLCYWEVSYVLWLFIYLFIFYFIILLFSSFLSEIDSSLCEEIIL